MTHSVHVAMEIMNVYTDSTSTLLVGCKKEHLACKKLNGKMLAWSSVGNQGAYSPTDATATYYVMFH